MIWSVYKLTITKEAGNGREKEEGKDKVPE
jgi:hypothetical protein